MNDRPEWFAPKRYGYGFSLPIAWQGWLVLFLYIVALWIVTRLLLDRSGAAFVGAIIGITILFVFIASRTTRGGWRWRWGEDD